MKLVNFSSVVKMIYITIENNDDQDGIDDALYDDRFHCNRQSAVFVIMEPAE